MNKMFVTKKINFSKLLLSLPFIIIMTLLVIIPAVTIIVYALIPAFDNNLKSNFEIIDDFVWRKIWKSSWISISTLLLTTVISYPVCAILAWSKNQVFKVTVMMALTAPMWNSFLVKLIGIKSFFDILLSQENSTYGDIYTVIGLVYIYCPYMMVPIYSVLNLMPKNLVLASWDLGYNKFLTFINVVIPYSKTAFFSGASLVLLPAFTTVAVPQFLNNNNNASMLGDYIFNIGSNGLESREALIQASSISLIISLIIFFVCLIFKIIPKIYYLIRSSKFRSSVKNYFTKIVNFIFIKTNRRK